MIPNQPNRKRSPLAVLVGSVLIVGVLWFAVAGISGYSLGNPPASVVAPCFQTMRVLFVVPMWKAAPAATCEGR